MSDSKKAKPARKSAPKASGTGDATPVEASTDAAAAAAATADAVEAATAQAVDDVAEATDALSEPVADAAADADADAAVASAAEGAAETVADAANEAAAEAAAAAAADAAAAETAATPTQDDAAAPVRTIYVTAPAPPAKKGNRVLGILIALLATAVFAALYAGAFAVVRMVQGGVAELTAFLGSASFVFPVVIVFIVFTLWALLVNRAGWWSWILGSFIVAAAVYAGTIAFAQLFYQMQISWTEPVLIVSAVLAREVTVWFGGILSARGKRLKVRNAEARAQFDREEAERRAERANAS